MLGRMMNYLDVEYPTINVDYVMALADHLKSNYLPPKGTLLDVGSGTNDYMRAFELLGYHTYGVDRPTNLDLDEWPCRTGWFDIVFSKSTLEHLRNTEFVLKEVKRVLKPDGLVLFMAPILEKDNTT